MNLNSALVIASHMRVIYRNKNLHIAVKVFQMRYLTISQPKQHQIAPYLNFMLLTSTDN